MNRGELKLILDNPTFLPAYAERIRCTAIDLSKRLGRSITINVAGSRESKALGLQELTQKLIVRAFNDA